VPGSPLTRTDLPPPAKKSSRFVEATSPGDWEIVFSTGVCSSHSTMDLRVRFIQFSTRWRRFDILGINACSNIELKTRNQERSPVEEVFDL
jgi:hypothetical protein